MTDVGSQTEPDTRKQYISQHRLDNIEQNLSALNVVVEHLWISRNPNAIRCLRDIAKSTPGHVGNNARTLIHKHSRAYKNLAQTLSDTAKHVASCQSYPTFMQGMWRRMDSDDPRIQRIHRELEWGGQDLKHAIENLAYDSPNDAQKLIEHLRKFF